MTSQSRRKSGTWVKDLERCFYLVYRPSYELLPVMAAAILDYCVSLTSDMWGVTNGIPDHQNMVLAHDYSFISGVQSTFC